MLQKGEINNLTLFSYIFFFCKFIFIYQSNLFFNFAAISEIYCVKAYSNHQKAEYYLELEQR